MSSLDRVRSLILKYHEPIGHPPEYNIEIQWAHQIGSGVQYWSTMSPLDTVISLVLIYAGTSTIFANFRTFIRLYLIIFYRYIALYVATLHCTSTLHSYSYVTTLCHIPTSQPYVATLRRTSMLDLCRITTTLLHCIATASCRSMWQFRWSDHLGPKGQLLHRMHMTMQQVQTVSEVSPTQPLAFLQPELI
jgi:hypothetical protein